MYTLRKEDFNTKTMVKISVLGGNIFDPYAIGFSPPMVYATFYKI